MIKNGYIDRLKQAYEEEKKREMKDPDREKYLAIYNDCLEKKYYNSSFGQLNDLLYIIIEDLDNSPILPVLSDNSKVKIIRDLIILFTRIVNDKRENQLYGAYKLILYMSGIFGSLDKSELVTNLKVFLYPEEAYVEKNFYYHRLISGLVDNYIMKKNFDDKSFDQSKFDVLDPRLIRILDMYREYHAGIMNCRDDFNFYISFCTHMNNVVAQFYINKYDINLFPKVLDYVFNNVEQLNVFYKLNRQNEDKKIDEAFMRLIIDSCTKDIPVIK